MILRNIKIINFNNVVENADIEIKNGKIIKIIQKQGDSNFIAIPGFIDTHIHGFAGYDSMDGKNAIEIISKKIGKFGTCAFFPTLMTSSFENILNKLKEAIDAKSVGAEIAGIHLEGPYISKVKKGAHDEKHIKIAKDQELEKLIMVSKDKLKKITIAPEAVNQRQIDFLISKGVMPSLGHSNTDANTAKKYIAKGVRSVTHLWNAMSGVANRNPGLVEACLNSDKVYAELICDLIHVDKDAINLTIKTKKHNKIIAVTDSIRSAGLIDGEYKSGGFDVVKKGNLITLKETSTIAGSAATMMDNFKNLIMLGFDIKDVVAMTSTNAAALFNLDNIGEISEGKFASINLLNKKGELERVFIKGEEQ